MEAVSANICSLKNVRDVHTKGWYCDKVKTDMAGILQKRQAIQ